MMDKQRGDHSSPADDSTFNHQYHNHNHRAHPSADHHRYHRRHHYSDHHRHHRSFNSQLNDSPLPWEETNFAHSSSLSAGARKRHFSPDYADGGRIGKLFVGSVPRTASEEDIRSVFGEYGNVIEVVLIKDKKTGQQQECCFVKYATLEEADRAIGALHDQYTFPWGVAPVRVKYADGEKERFSSFGQHLLKLYVGCVNRQASEREIEEIFSPYGVIEDVFIVRDEMKQHRGCAFVQFSRREMAVAAISALHGVYIMKGCEQPLVVRFAEPKKPRWGGWGDSRAAPYLGDRIAMMPNDSHQPQNIKCKPHSVCEYDTSESALHFSDPSSYPVFTSTEPADYMDCEWSEHICPDGDPYYYNCVTCESRWEKPEEYACYEQQLLKLEQQQQI